MILSSDPGAESAPATRSGTSGNSSASRTPERTRVVSPFNTLIRPEPWISWIIVVFGLTLWGAALRFGWSIDRSDSGLKDVLGLRADRMTGLFAAICLLAVTQLSLVNLWYRTQSRKDFQGQYRVWIWSSLTWAVLFSGAISGWHVAVCDWLAQQFPGRLRPIVKASWLLAATILIATSLRLLVREMGRAAAPRWLMAGAACVGSITAFLRLQTGLVPAGVSTDVANACGALWPLLLASALLHHARYVIHVSNEALPMTSRVSRLSPVVQQVWAEVLQMGPSKATLTRSLAPRNLWTMALTGARSARLLFNSLSKLIQRRSLVRKARPEGHAGRRSKNPAPLPVAQPLAERPPRGSKSAANSAKSA